MYKRQDVIGLLKSIYHGTQLIPKQLIKYFCAWKSLAQLTPLMLADASQDALDLFDELCCSQRHRTFTNTLGGFVGLGTYVIRRFNGAETVVGQFCWNNITHAALIVRKPPEPRTRRWQQSRKSLT